MKKIWADDRSGELLAHCYRQQWDRALALMEQHDRGGGGTIGSVGPHARLKVVPIARVLVRARLCGDQSHELTRVEKHDARRNVDSTRLLAERTGEKRDRLLHSCEQDECVCEWVFALCVHSTD